MAPVSGSDITKKRATIRDVAALAGVSKSLVSLVFREPQSVSAERSARVLAAADALGFRPNVIARSLAAADGNFVGILVADLHNPLFAEIVDAARLRLAESGQFGLMTSAVLPVSGAAPQLDLRILSTFADLRPRSILVVGDIPDAHQLAHLSDGVPLVIASGVAIGMPSAMTVRGDDAAGMHLIVDHLVSRGHTRIAHAGGVGPIAEIRALAYREAMARQGLAESSLVMESDYTERGGMNAARMLLDSPDPPTAIVAVNDLAAIGVLSAVADSTSGPVAVAGYDNTFIAAIRGVDLTSVDPGNQTIGAQAADWLIGASKSDRQGREYLVPPTLVVRGSSLV